MQEDDWTTVCGTRLSVADVQDTSIDLLSESNDVFVPGFIMFRTAGFVLARLCDRSTEAT
jgi:hypothetical protein